MAIQVSTDQDGSRKDGGTARASTSTAIFIVAAIDALGRALFRIVERVRGLRSFERKRKRMQLVESLALGNRRQLLLIACGSQRYLVGAGADNVSSILAMEPGGDLAESLEPGFLGPGSRTRPRPIGRVTKGPELVRHKARQIASAHKNASEHESGSGLWP